MRYPKVAGEIRRDREAHESQGAVRIIEDRHAKVLSCLRIVLAVERDRTGEVSRPEIARGKLYCRVITDLRQIRGLNRSIFDLVRQSVQEVKVAILGLTSQGGSNGLTGHCWIPT
jgi:hypothetical protein